MADTRAIARARCHGRFLLRAAQRGFDIGLEELAALERLASIMRPCFEGAPSAGGRGRYNLTVKRQGKRRVTIVYDTDLSALVTIF